MKNQITRRNFIKTLGMSAATWGISGCLPRPLRKKPNIVLILADDFGWKDAGFMGSTYYETPNLDKLASQGVVFTEAYANSPNCAPSRACLLTGQYMPQHGIYTVGSRERGDSRLRKLIPVKNKTVLDTNAITITEVLKPSGYISASIGKWHLGDDPEYGPLSQGFDKNIGGNQRGHPQAGYFSPHKLPYLENAPDGEYLTDRLTNEAITFIESFKDEPFFLYLSHYAVHTPLQAKEALIEKYKKKKGSNGQNNPIFAAMIESMDQSIGRIMNKLDVLDLTEDTIVFFFSDNGGNKNITSSEPLRGGKGMLYEGGIRVPMIVHWPGKVKAGTTCHIPIMGIDFFPTILEATGIPKPDKIQFDGQSLLPLLTGKRILEREALFWHFPAYLEGKAEGARDPHFRTRPAAAVRKEEWKLIEYFEDGKLELYNLLNDIGEKDNLAKRMPEKTEELYRLMLDWRKSFNAPVPTKLNPEYDLKFNPESY